MSKSRNPKLNASRKSIKSTCTRGHHSNSDAISSNLTIAMNNYPEYLTNLDNPNSDIWTQNKLDTRTHHFQHCNHYKWNPTYKVRIFKVPKSGMKQLNTRLINLKMPNTNIWKSTKWVLKTHQIQHCNLCCSHSPKMLPHPSDPPKTCCFWRIRPAPIDNFEESEQHRLQPLEMKSHK